MVVNKMNSLSGRQFYKKDNFYNELTCAFDDVVCKFTMIKDKSLGDRYALLSEGFYLGGNDLVRNKLGRELLDSLFIRVSQFIIDRLKNPVYFTPERNAKCLDYRFFDRFRIQNTQNKHVPTLQIKIDNVWRDVSESLDRLGLNTGVFDYVGQDICDLQNCVIKMVLMDFTISKINRPYINTLLIKFLSSPQSIALILQHQPEVRHYLRASARCFNRVLMRLTHPKIHKALFICKENSIYIDPIRLDVFLQINKVAAAYPEKMEWLLNGNLNICSFALKSHKSTIENDSFFSIDYLNRFEGNIPDRRAYKYLLNCHPALFSLLTHQIVEQSHLGFDLTPGYKLKDSYLNLHWLSRSKLKNINPDIAMKVMQGLFDLHSTLSNLDVETYASNLITLGDMLYLSILETEKNELFHPNPNEIIDYASCRNNFEYENLRSFHKKTTLKSAGARIKLWHDDYKQLELSALKCHQYSNICQESTVGKFHFAPIRNNKDLLSESIDMNHCVYKFDQEILNGVYEVISITSKDEGLRATLGLSIIKKNEISFISFNQCTSKHNNPVPRSVDLACKVYIYEQNQKILAKESLNDGLKNA